MFGSFEIAIDGFLGSFLVGCRVLQVECVRFVCMFDALRN